MNIYRVPLLSNSLVQASSDMTIIMTVGVQSGQVLIEFTVNSATKNTSFYTVNQQYILLSMYTYTVLYTVNYTLLQ